MEIKTTFLQFKDESKDDCLVSTSTGIYRGTQIGSVQVFKGIRYALPPVGDLRFRLPTPVPQSDNLIDARSFSSVSFQPGSFARLSGADSLSLNIWRNTEADMDAPVLFFVHGGSFYQGFMHYFHITDVNGLRRLSDKEIMLKTPAFMKKSGLGLGTFQPVIDGYYLKAYPINVLRSGNYKTVPILIGNTGDELSVMKYSIGRRYWDLGKIISEGLSNERESTRKQISLLYAKKYGRREAQVQLLSDMIFRTAALFYAEAASSKCPVWLYRFDLRPATMRLSGLGAAHCSDLPLIFGNLRKGIGKLMFCLSADLTAASKLSHDMQADIIGFMKNGKLPWARAFTDEYLAKCYNVPPGFDEPIPLDIYKAYQQTHYYALNRRKAL